MFQPSRWIRHLEGHGVAYVLVGGFAGALHGSRRPTIDIDVVPAWTPENLDRLVEALRHSHAKARTGPPVEGEAITPQLLTEREVTNWETDLGPIDVLLGIPDRDGLPVTYEELRAEADYITVDDEVVAVASLDALVESKAYAGRRKDAEALPELRRLQEQQVRSGEGEERG